jgi:hypothetical protein
MSELDASEVVPGATSDVIEAAKSGNLELVKKCVLADAGCVHTADEEYDSPAALSHCPFLFLKFPTRYFVAIGLR